MSSIDILLGIPHCTNCNAQIPRASIDAQRDEYKGHKYLRAEKSWTYKCIECDCTMWIKHVETLWDKDGGKFSFFQIKGL